MDEIAIYFLIEAVAFAGLAWVVSGIDNRLKRVEHSMQEISRRLSPSDARVASVTTAPTVRHEGSSDYVALDVSNDPLVRRG